jgi:hypothetical protein
VPPPYCTFPDNVTFVAAQGHSGSDNGQQSILSEEVFSPALLEGISSVASSSESSGNVTERTTIATTRTLRVDIHHDSFPQEISWALAQQQSQSQPLLKHISPRRSIALRNQRVSQHILAVEPGSYVLEFYDTIAGDGIIVPSDVAEDAIRVWQVTIMTTTTFTFTTNALIAQVGRNEGEQTEVQDVVNVDEEEDVSTTIIRRAIDETLLWSHRGDFGEFVRASVEVAPL